MDQARIHRLHTLGMAGHVVSQESQELAERRLVSFAACSAADQHLAAGADAVLDLLITHQAPRLREGRPKSLDLTSCSALSQE